MELRDEARKPPAKELRAQRDEGILPRASRGRQTHLHSGLTSVTGRGAICCLALSHKFAVNSYKSQGNLNLVNNLEVIYGNSIIMCNLWK